MRKARNGVPTPFQAKPNLDLRFASNVRQHLTNPQNDGNRIMDWSFGSCRWSSGVALPTNCKATPGTRKNTVKIKKQRLKNPLMKAD
jgi:hypothetical protein